MSLITPALELAMRKAILANYAIVNILPVYLNSPTVFTRRPIPPDAPYPMIVISDDVGKFDTDGLSDQRPYITKDISVYGLNDTSEHYREINDISYIVFDIFHRKRDAIYVSNGWMVASIVCTGPIGAPVDDDLHVGNVISVITQLAAPL